ncbi:MAG TPA: RAMP superfamily CRISPR-associated protein, partial [Elainellaceae cyanobacterium]
MTQAANNLTPKETFTVQLEFLSDWHIGSGMGRPGDVDRLVQRDRHNLPYIPAKSLTGIWRDACERVAYGLDNSQSDGVWQQWVTYLFGDQPADPERPIEKAETAPRPATLSVRSAHFPEALQNALISKPRLHDLICIIKPGIKIEALTGCAEPDCLRMEERVRGGAVLSTNCTLSLPADEDSRMVVYALLVAGTQFVERIGGKRRRGAGKCRCIIPDEPTNGWINWIDQNRQPTPPPTLEEQDDHSDSVSTPNLEPNAEGSWECFDLAIEALSPLVIATRTIGNVVESLDYIPGNYLLRLVLNRLRQSNLLDSAAIHRAIAQHDLVITPATIEISDKPGHPVPLCWEADKQAGGLQKGGRVYNSFMKAENTEDEDSNLQLKGERGYYIGQSDGNTLPDSAKVIKGIATHNVIEDAVQRPSEAVGGVFSYEAIAPKTRFRAQLRLRHTLAHAIKQAYRDQQPKQPKSSDWWTCLNGSHRIGVSKKDDYGAVHLSVREAELPKLLSQDSEAGQLLYVWLLSDTLIRDQRLRFSTQVEDLKQALSKALGSNITLHTVDVRQQTSRVESWQCSWGLPRPSMVGIQAGSCFVFRSDSAISAESLQRVQIEGIGDRTAEGYGQVCFNDPLIMKPTSDKAPQSSNSDSLNSEQSEYPLLGEQSDGFAYAQI